MRVNSTTNKETDVTRVVIPKEILHAEKRVAAIPETVEKLRKKGFEVAVESGAGSGIFIEDAEYEKAGATVVKDVKELFARPTSS